MSVIGNSPLDNRRPRWCRWLKSRRKRSEDLLLCTNAPSISSSLAPDRRARRWPTASPRTGASRSCCSRPAARRIRCRAYPISFASFINRPGVNWLYASEPEDNHGRARNPRPARAHARRLQRHQRHGMGARPAPGLRSLGPARQPRLELPGRAADLQEHGKLRRRRRRDPRSRGAAQDLRQSTRAAGSTTASSRPPRPSGIKHNRDYNGADQEGIAMTQASISSGRRMSTARCYLDPARTRANLTIETDAMAESLILEGNRCVGVRYASQARTRGARGARGHRLGRLHRLTAAAGAFRHRPGASASRASASRSAMICPASARTCATTGRRA